jgi:hypothetical protein
MRRPPAEKRQTQPDLGMIQSIEEHRKIPKGGAAMMPVGGSRKWRRVQIWPRSDARRGRKGPGEVVNQGGSWLPPAGRCPIVQK